MYGIDYEKKEDTLYTCYQVDDSKKPVSIKGIHKLRSSDKIVYT